MKLSLIINTYNRPSLLEKCLMSLSNQSEFPDEIIVADDGSKEDIISVLKKFKEKFNNIPIKFVTQDDTGFRLSRCRNNGAREASSDFLFYVDQDLIFTKNFIKTIKDNIKYNHFIVGWPIRTTEEQLGKITDYDIENFNFDKFITEKQTKLVKKQFCKDSLYRILNNLKLRKRGVKFRGGVSGFFKNDFIKINGYDENYIGWGNEDDDFGRRLYYSGVKGINPFKSEFPVHLWHQEFHGDNERVNLDYHKLAGKNLSKDNFRCEFGYDNTLGEDKYRVIEI